jgi:hypothetical protein
MLVGEASQRLRAESRVVKSPDVVHVVGVGKLWLEETATCSS